MNTEYIIIYLPAFYCHLYSSHSDRTACSCVCAWDVCMRMRIVCIYALTLKRDAYSCLTLPIRTVLAACSCVCVCMRMYCVWCTYALVGSTLNRDMRRLLMIDNSHSDSTEYCFLLAHVHVYVYVCICVFCLQP